MLQRNGMVMMVMKVLVAMVMMMMMMMIRWSPARWRWRWQRFPPSGKEFPRQISAYRRAFSLCVFSAPQRWRSLFVFLPPVLGFRGDDIHEGALAEVGQGGHTTWWRGLGLARAMGWCGPLMAHLGLSFWLLPSSSKIGTSRYFSRIADLQKYGVLIVLFPAESWLRQWIL
jgi:hypothetical protein